MSKGKAIVLTSLNLIEMLIALQVVAKITLKRGYPVNIRVADTILGKRIISNATASVKALFPEYITIVKEGKQKSAIEMTPEQAKKFLEDFDDLMKLYGGVSAVIRVHTVFDDPEFIEQIRKKLDHWHKKSMNVAQVVSIDA